MYGDQIYVLYETIYIDKFDLSSGRDNVIHVTFSKRFAKRWAARKPTRFVREMKITKNEQSLVGVAAAQLKNYKERIKKQQAKESRKRVKQRKLEKEKEEKKQNKHVESKFEAFDVNEYSDLEFENYRNYVDE